MAAYQNYETERYDDLKQMLHACAEKYGNKLLFTQKVNGVYERYGYRRYCADVCALGSELLSRELGGRRIAVIGENCYAWVLSYMAVICGVGTVVPMDASIGEAEFAERLARADVSAVIASANVRARLHGTAPSLLWLDFEELEALIASGKARIRGGDRRYLDAEIDPDGVATVVFTSGTADRAKGVMLSHRNLCFSLSEMSKMILIDERDSFLSVLPLHHVYETVCGFLCPLYRGAAVAFGEGLRKLMCNMQEVRPTVMLCVPKLMETLYQRIWANARLQGVDKKLRNAVKVTDAIPKDRVRIATKRRVFDAIHKSFGGRLRLLISGGEAADPTVMQGLRSLGFGALQGYGLSECTSLVALNRDGFYNDRAAGLCTPNTLLDIKDVRDDGTGEIRFRGENVMLGYLDDPEATARVLRGGWFYTGDLGYIDEKGFLYVTGRKQNRIKGADGRLVYPEELERYLMRTVAVREAVVVGYPKEDGDYAVIALLYPDFDRLAALHGRGLTDARIDLEMQKAVAEVNSLLPSDKRMDGYLRVDCEFSKNTSGKICREGLSEQYLAAYTDKYEI